MDENQMDEKLFPNFGQETEENAKDPPKQLQTRIRSGLLFNLTLVNHENLPIPLWPNGDFVVELSLQELSDGLQKTQWAWKNNRVDKVSTVHGDGRATTYTCQGVWCCVKCQWTLRPKMRQKDLKEQARIHSFFFQILTCYLEERCGVCPSEIMHISCKARQISTVFLNRGVYEHQGYVLMLNHFLI
jgi:hypothetical protein